MSESGTVLALSGRRIDADGAPERFPLRNRYRVEGLIRAAMIDAAAHTLVSSAACGSDLLALKAAGDLGIRRRVILPFDQATFRDQSVVDRPGDWGPLFDRILSEVGRVGDLKLLGLQPSDRFVYEETNRAILSEGEALSGQVDGGACVAVVVWDGQAGQRDDHTQQFFEEAFARGWPLYEVFSLEQAP